MKNIIPYSHSIKKKDRTNLLNQKPFVLWFTGLSASGKSTIADILEQQLSNKNYLTYILDGDNIRHGLNSDLGFSENDRMENLRRIGQVASLFLDAGIIVLSAFISPFKKDRLMVQSLFEEDEFIEIFVDASISVCEKRDPKGIYKKARLGEIKKFTGIDSPYEKPSNPHIHIKTDLISPDEAVDQILFYLKENNFINWR